MISRSRLLEAQFDYAAFYLRTLQQWEAHFQRAESLADRAAFEQDVPQIWQAQSWCAAHSQTQPTAAQFCSAFGMIDSTLLESYQTPDAQIAWYRAAVDAARLLNEPAAEIRHVRHLALSYGRMGEYAQGVELLQEALTRHSSLGADLTLRAHLLNSLGDLLNTMGNPQEAETHYLESLSLSAPDSEAHTHALWGLSGVYNTLSRLDEAIAHAERGQAYYQRTGNTLRLAQIAGRLGEIQYTQGKYDLALASHWESIRLSEQIGYRRGLTIAYRNLAYIANEQGELQESEQHFERSLQYAQQLGDLREHAILLGGLGQLHWRRGAYAAAAACFRESLAACEQTGDPIGMAYMLINLSKVHQHTEAYSEALASLEQAQAILERLGEPWGQAKVSMSLGDLALRQGDHDRAVGHFRAMLIGVEAIGDARGQTLAWIGIGKAEQGRGQMEAALAAYQQALTLARAIATLPLALEALVGFAEVWYAQGHIHAALPLLGCVLTHPQRDDETLLACTALIARARLEHGSAPLDDLLAEGAQIDPEQFIPQH